MVKPAPRVRRFGAVRMLFSPPCAGRQSGRSIWGWAGRLELRDQFSIDVRRLSFVFGRLHYVPMYLTCAFGVDDGTYHAQIQAREEPVAFLVYSFFLTTRAAARRGGAPPPLPEFLLHQPPTTTRNRAMTDPELKGGAFPPRAAKRPFFGVLE